MDTAQQAERLVGAERVRVFRLYLRAARNGFRSGLSVRLPGARPPTAGLAPERGLTRASRSSAEAYAGSLIWERGSPD